MPHLVHKSLVCCLLAAFLLSAYGCGPKNLPEGAGFVGTAVTAAKDRGEDTTGYERAMELMLETGQRKLTDAEVNEMVELAQKKGDKIPAKRTAAEVFAMMAVNKDETRAIAAVDKFIKEASPEQMPAVLRALGAANDPRFEEYAQKMLSHPEEFVRTSAEVALKARSLGR